MSRKIVPIGVGLTCCIAFLILVLAPGGCGFNFLPYEIHESISPGGSGETLFIQIFDIIFSIAIFFAVFLILKGLWKKS
jgi:hypothetical protein